MVSQVSEEKRERRVKEGRRASEGYQGEKEPKGRRGNPALLDWTNPALWEIVVLQAAMGIQVCQAWMG